MTAPTQGTTATASTVPLPDSLEIKPVSRATGRVRPPGSKSLTNRAIVVAALADGRSNLTGALDSEDTQVMIESWRQLGVKLDHNTERNSIKITGCGGKIPAASAELFVANSGTTMRFLTAAVALGNGSYHLDGVPRMRERPMEELLAALRKLGADARSETGNGCPPIRVKTNGLRGGELKMAGDQSSQFASAILLAAPFADGDVSLRITGELVSEPFVRMTVRVMREFGVVVDSPAPGEFQVHRGQRYQAQAFDIEPDATAASYFWAVAAITGGEVTVDGIGTNSVQGDVAFVDLLEKMGAKVLRGPNSITVAGRDLKGIDADLRAISDTALTLAVVAAHAAGPTRISGIAHVRSQETDRIRAVATELQKLGATVTEHDDGLTITPGSLRGARIDTYNDHRIAMSFALAGLRTPGVVVENPACVSKTYPRYFDDLRLIAAP